MTSLPPKVRRILTPPPVTANVNLVMAGSTGQAAANHVVTCATQQLATDPCSNLATQTTASQSMQRYVTLHPVLLLTAYVLEDPQQPTYDKIITVQHIVTRQVLFRMSLVDVAAILYGETDLKKLPAASKSLGTVVSLAFYDAATLYWSGMLMNSSSSAAAAGAEGDEADSTTAPPAESPSVPGLSPRWQTLAVQTTSRIILINLRQGATGRSITCHPTDRPKSVPTGPGMPSQLPHTTAFCRIQGHLCEKTLGAIPSSNILPVSETWLLVGCADGSLKCYDWVHQVVVKSIKGLGKGDWIVQLVAANRYATVTTEENPRRRILTVTKKGIAYLIELEASKEKQQLEIKPPLARFMGGMAENTTAVHMTPAGKSRADAEEMQQAFWEHPLLFYDAHRDWILWLTSPKNKGTTLLVWNLRMLQADFIQQIGGKNLFKPDATLSVVFPPTETSLTVCPSLVHSAFAEDTVLTAVVTATGDLHLMGATAHPNNAVSQVTATPILSVQLPQIIQRDASLDWTPVVRAHALVHQPLSCSTASLVVATNVGLVVLELPADTIVAGGARHMHFGAGLGSLGKSILSVHQSNVVYSSLDTLLANPVGRMEAKNPVTVFESTSATTQGEASKRPFRLPPTFLPSPSGLYVCLFWSAEFRYEVLHVATLLQKVGGQRSGNQAASQRSPKVASGEGIANFCWVGDDDVFCLLHAPDLVQQALENMAVIVKSAEGERLTLQQFTNLKDIGKLGINVANLATSVTMNTAKAATLGTISAAKAGAKAGMTATTATINATQKVATTAANATVVSVTKVGTSVTKAGVATLAVSTKVVKTANKGVMKSLRVFGKKKKEKEESGSSGTGGSGGGGMLDTQDDEEETEEMTQSSMLFPMSPMAIGISMPDAAKTQDGAENNRRYVELQMLVAVDSQAAELSVSVAAATVSQLGEMMLRGGNRSPPSVIFGGPVLCVGTRTEDDPKGFAHFYTRKKDETENQASVYVSSGPTLPYPDLVVWDDDGRICALAVQSRVAIYLSNIPEYVLLGTVRIASGSDLNGRITSMKFLHGVLYVCTWNAVHVVFLGDLEEGRLCQLDTYLLSTSDVYTIPDKAIASKYTGLTPPVIPLPLVQPVVLGYQSGSLIVSTARGVQAIPLPHPILRIGTLIAAGQIPRAVKWLDAIPNSDHEGLASFLERRGCPDLAVELPGVSLETVVDISMRHGFINKLEEVVENYGAKGLRAIDMGRGVSPSIFGPEQYANSVVVCAGAYLLAHGRVELARRLATECLRSGEDGKKDAFVLAALLLSVDEADATRVIHRAVEEGSGIPDDWIVGNFVRDHILSDRA